MDSRDATAYGKEILNAFRHIVHSEPAKSYAVILTELRLEPAAWLQMHVESGSSRVDSQPRLN